MSAAARPASRMRLLAAATGYELRKKIQFRVGFLVREVLNGAVEPLVMLFVYRALYRSAGGDGARLGGWTYPEIVQYVAGLLVVRKLVFNERGLELSTEIFEGRVTKYLVMPFPYFVLAQARFVQFVGLQLVVALLVWGIGYAAVPEHWLVPVSGLATLQALALALLGSYCCFLVYFTINAAAFWLDVIWSLLVMAAFVILFIGGGTIPVSQMPEGVADALRWAFPYWTISAPIELLLGRIGTPEFLRGVLVLGGWLTVLETVRRVTWRRGLARYVGAGM